VNENQPGPAPGSATPTAQLVRDPLVAVPGVSGPAHRNLSTSLHTGQRTRPTSLWQRET
jgi:hypothetical protein